MQQKRPSLVSSGYASSSDEEGEGEREGGGKTTIQTNLHPTTHGATSSTNGNKMGNAVHTAGSSGGANRNSSNNTNNNNSSNSNNTTSTKKRILIQALPASASVDPAPPPSKKMRALGSLADSLPAPIASVSPFVSSSKPAKPMPESNLGKASGLQVAGNNNHTMPTSYEEEEEKIEEEEEEMDFFGLEPSSQKVTLVSKNREVLKGAPVLGPARPPPKEKAPFVFKPPPMAGMAGKEKIPFVFTPPPPRASSSSSSTIPATSSSSKRHRDDQHVQISTLPTISHSDQLDPDAAHQRSLRSLTILQMKDARLDPFAGLGKGHYVASEGESRVNGLLSLAHKAKAEYVERETRKEERKAVRKVVRAKYGF